MFESAELGHTIDKDAYEMELPELRAALLNAQVDLVQARSFPLIVIVAGVDGAGKSETVHLLNQWMDPRHVETHALGDPDAVAHERPPMWRFWKRLPPNGKVGVFFGSWYTTPLYQRAYAKMKRARFEHHLDEIVRFERMLTDEGALVVKLWLHLSKKGQRARFKSLSRDPKTRWRVTDSDWRNHAHYGSFKRSSEEALLRTSTENAPWVVIDGENERYRNLTVGKVLLAAIEARLARAEGKKPEPARPMVEAVEKQSVLGALDLSKSLDKKDYQTQLEDRQGELNFLSRKLAKKGISVTAAFEGFDAAGKGGAIRRVADALDARHYRIIPIAAPTEEERAHPYLWRFWKHIPGRGELTIFDRSWYGRVLVERVESLCSERDWMRAYTEINDFEEQLSEHGTVLVKFWLSISKQEQLARFQEREQTQFKRFKLTDEDWRNREKWEDYERAAGDMIERTSTAHAPWTLVEGNDKPFARIKILDTLIAHIKSAM